MNEIGSECKDKGYRNREALQAVLKRFGNRVKRFLY